MNPSVDIDIAIAGGGPVGMALAAMLLARGVDASRIALIDAKSIETATQDPRSIALSYGSRQLLEQIHAWPATASAITEIHVSRRGSLGRTLIHAQDYGLPALGYVARYGDVVQALAQALENSGIASYRPVAVIDRQAADSHISLSLTEGQRITAKLLIQAEGGVFSDQAARQVQRDYAQHAIVATVHSNAPLAGRAFERFTDEGPLALLPQHDAYSLVWCVSPENKDRLLALSDMEFLQALQVAFGQRVGNFIHIGKRNSYALGLNAKPESFARTISIGNAAQTLHPVAGQGLNLGLRDAMVLARLLAHELSQHTESDLKGRDDTHSTGSTDHPSEDDISHTNCYTTKQVNALIAQFTQQRRMDRSATVGLTDVMARIFASSPEASFTQNLLGLSLGMIDMAPSAKRALAEQMMFGVR